MTSFGPIRPFGSADLPLPTGAEAAAFDHHAIDELGVPQFTLMENAGRSAAQLVDDLFPDGLVVGVVGAGNNGGDALVLLRTLAAWGRPVRAVVCADRSADEVVLHGWDLPTVHDQELGDSPEAWAAAFADAAVLVDGLLGTGLSGPPRERQARAIEALNLCPAPVVSLDIPSGGDAVSGATPGSVVEAVATVALGWPKLGSLLHPTRAAAGRLLAVEIGFPVPSEAAFTARALTPAWAAEVRPRREPDSHKNSAGNVLVVAGRVGMAGAAILAARAAIRSGAGYVRIASVPENRELLQEAVPDAVFVDRTEPEALAEAARGAGAILVGPGMGTDPSAVSLLEAVVASSPSVPMVADADALTLLGEGVAGGVAAVAQGRDLVVTPHPGEMSRLVGQSIAEVLEDRPGQGLALARDGGAVVLLKGLPSVVATPEGRLWVDTVGTSDLAAAGMGDALAGAIAAFLAQGAPGATGAGLGLVTAGRAAARAARGPGLSPEDVIGLLPDALQEGPGETDLTHPFLIFDQDAAR